MPGPLQKNERALYYLGVNKALQEFRLRNHLSHRELNAFLYVFATQYLAVEQDKDLPEPQRVWFMMAGVGTTADFDFLDNAKDGTECNWRGNRDARRGDVAVMWCASPRAYLVGPAKTPNLACLLGFQGKCGRAELPESTKYWFRT